MTLKTTEDYEQRRNKQVSGMRSTLDYAMGAIILGVGAFLLFRHLLDIDFNKSFPPDTSDKVFGVVFLLYGCWRLYRGYKKNNFR